LLRETHHTAAQTSSAASCGGLPPAAQARAAQRPGALSATDRRAGRTARSAAYTTARVGLSRERRRRRPRPALAVVASAPGRSRTPAPRRDRLLRGRAAALPSPVPKELLHGRPPTRRPVDRLRDHRVVLRLRARCGLVRQARRLHLDRVLPLRPLPARLGHGP